MNNELYAALDAAEQQEREYAFVMVLDKGPQCTRRSGKMAVFADGSTVGTLGGGEAQKKVIADALAILSGGKASEKEYSDIGEGSSSGDACGSFFVWIEPVRRREQLLIFGAGAVGTALTRMARLYGYKVVLFDTREEDQVAEAAQAADKYVKLTDIRQDLLKREFSPRDAVVVMMFSPLADQLVLEALHGRHFSYLGMIGSEGKKARIYPNLRQAGFTDAELNAILCPIGLPIGGDAPFDTAVSILAQIIQIKNGH